MKYLNRPWKGTYKGFYKSHKIKLNWYKWFAWYPITFIRYVPDPSYFANIKLLGRTFIWFRYVYRRSIWEGNSDWLYVTEKEYNEYKEYFDEEKE